MRRIKISSLARTMDIPEHELRAKLAALGIAVEDGTLDAREVQRRLQGWGTAADALLLLLLLALALVLVAKLSDLW